MKVIPHRGAHTHQSREPETKKDNADKLIESSGMLAEIVAQSLKEHNPVRVALEMYGTFAPGMAPVSPELLNGGSAILKDMGTEFDLPEQKPPSVLAQVARAAADTAVISTKLGALSVQEKVEVAAHLLSLKHKK